MRPMLNARPNARVEPTDTIRCDWTVISSQLMNQWDKLTEDDLERTRHSRHGIALLVEQRYGVDSVLTENYLKNLEVTLPLFQ